MQTPNIPSKSELTMAVRDILAQCDLSKVHYLLSSVCALPDPSGAITFPELRTELEEQFCDPCFLFITVVHVWSFFVFWLSA
jgi:hypothetical protein